MQRIHPLRPCFRPCSRVAAALLGAGLLVAPAAPAPAAAAGVGPPCPADLDGNDVVDFSDLLIVLGEFNQSAEGDIDGDQDTDFDDLLILLGAFGPCPDDGPVIDDVQPRAAAAGEIVEIFGQGFGNDPEDICLGGEGFGFRVLEANDTHLRALVLPFDPDMAQPGPLGLAIGQGIRQVPGPAFEIPKDLAIQEPIWCWQQAPDGPVALGGFAFTPVPGIVGPTDVFQSELVDGDLVIDLEGVSWQAGDKIRIVARAWCELRHIDCTLPTFRLLAASPEPEQCALAICLLIQEAYEQLDVDIQCTIGPGPSIRLSYPDCDIEPGISLTSSIARTACPFGDAPPVEIQELIADGPVDEGEIISIIGAGFPGPLDLCVQILGGPSVTPLTVIGDRLIGQVGPIPPNAQPGPLFVARGRGTFVLPDQFFVPGVDILAATDGFQGDAGFPNDAILDLAVPPGKPSGDTSRFTFEPDSRSLVLQLEGDWEPGDTIRVDVHFDANSPDGTTRHYDCFADDVQIPPGADPDPNACAQAICGIITQTFANQTPPVDVECNVNGATITIRTPKIGQLKGGGGTVRRIPG